jgi:hypothetical protein
VQARSGYFATQPEAEPPAVASYEAKNNKAKVRNATWSPPEVDAPLASLSAAQACSLPDVLAHAGERAQELVADLQRFSANEKVQYEEVDSSGMVNLNETSDYDYVVSFRQKPGALLINESRHEPGGGKGLTGRPPDQGLPSLALIFHPDYQGDYDIRCEGLADWEGTPAWVVHFVQRKDRPSRLATVSTSQGEVPLNLKGRAWIAADSYQMLHIETNLVEPVPLPQLGANARSINRLDSYDMSIDYAPVDFQAQNVQLWLPQSAESFTEFAAVFSEKTVRSVIKHTFADFLLFSVQTNQTIEKPVQP